MNYVLETALMGRLVATLCAALLAGCTGSEEPDGTCSDTAVGEGRAELVALGLRGDLGLFLQPLWVGGELSYLILNARDEAVDVAVNTSVADNCTGWFVGALAAGPWTVAARSHRVVSGSDVMNLLGRAMTWFADDTWLGSDFLYLQPSFSNLGTVVSTHGTNGGGGGDLAQIESDFVVAPGPTFTMTLVVPPGELRLEARGPSDLGIPVLDVLAVRSEQGTVLQTPSGFSVIVTYPDDADARDEFEMTGGVRRIDVDVAVPASTGDVPGVFFDSWFCAAEGSRECGRAYPMDRVVPLSH